MAVLHVPSATASPPTAGEVIISATCTRTQPCELFGLTVKPLSQGEVADSCRHVVRQQQGLVINVLEAAKAMGHADADEHVHQALVTRDLEVASGLFVAVAGPALRQWLEQRVDESEHFRAVLAMAERHGGSAYLLGASDTCLEVLQERLGELHPTLAVVGSHHGYLWAEHDEREEVLSEIERSRPDLLLVGMRASVRETVLATRGLRRGLGGAAAALSGLAHRGSRHLGARPA